MYSSTTLPFEEITVESPARKREIIIVPKNSETPCLAHVSLSAGCSALTLWDFLNLKN